MRLEKNSTESTVPLKKSALPKNSEQFAAEIVHEIRNPLATIKGFLQLIKPYLKEVGKEQYAEIALTELNRANELIYGFLKGTISQAKSLEIVSLNQVVNELVLLYESEAFLKKIQFIFNLSRQDAILSIPAAAIKQVLINIINNAIEAIDEIGTTDRKVCISTQIDSTMAEISITDSGVGIADENLTNLFTPYYTSKEYGTGIGLSICKKIIEEYNGSIMVKSSPGKYTTFTVWMPIKEFAD